MTANSSTVRVSARSIALALAVLLGLAACMFLINSIDGKRRYEQFLELTEKTETSPHLKNLNALIAEFDVNDSISVRRISGQLNLFAEDADEISSCRLLVPYGEETIVIKQSYRPLSGVEIASGLPSKEERLIRLLSGEDRNGLKEKIYGITKGDGSRLWTMVRAGNGYLITSRYRD